MAFLEIAVDRCGSTGSMSHAKRCHSIIVPGCMSLSHASVEVFVLHVGAFKPLVLLSLPLLYCEYVSNC